MLITVDVVAIVVLNMDRSLDVVAITGSTTLVKVRVVMLVMGLVVVISLRTIRTTLVVVVASGMRVVMLVTRLLCVARLRNS